MTTLIKGNKRPVKSLDLNTRFATRRQPMKLTTKKCDASSAFRVCTPHTSQAACRLQEARRELSPSPSNLLNSSPLKMALRFILAASALIHRSPSSSSSSSVLVCKGCSTRYIPLSEGPIGALLEGCHLDCLGVGCLLNNMGT